MRTLVSLIALAAALSALAGEHGGVPAPRYRDGEDPVARRIGNMTYYADGSNCERRGRFSWCSQGRMR